MKIEQVDFRTIKIELSGNDMEELAITYDEMDYASPTTRKAILEIMRRVQKKIKLDVEANKLFIEAFPSEDGGCTLLVNLVEFEVTGEELPKKRESLTVPLIFEVAELDILVSLCHRLAMSDSIFIAKSELMRYERSYILLLYTYSRMEEKICNLVQEYGIFLGKGAIKYAFFAEHAKLILDVKAVEKLLDCIG